MLAPSGQDDYFPCDETGQLVFGRNRRSKEEYWVAVVEKAYAKLCGCYYALERGNESDALVDLTGGVALTMDLRCPQLPRSELAQRLSAFQGRGYVLGCARNHGGDCRGIAQDHAYQLVRVLPQLPLLTGERVDLVQLRSPWARACWRGDWCPESPVWDLVAPAVRASLRADRACAEGSFYMLADDLCAVFDKLYLCRAAPDTYGAVTVRGSWARDARTSGGRSDCATWVCNPQYRITVDRPVLALLVLSQRDRRRAFSPTAAAQPIGFSLFRRAEGGRRVVFAEGVAPHGELLERACFCDMRERTLLARLLPEEGPYVVVPALYRPGAQSAFLFTVFAENAARIDVAPAAEWPCVRRCCGRWTAERSGGCSNYASWRRNPSFTLRTAAAQCDVVLVLTTEEAAEDFDRAPSVGVYVLQHGNVVSNSPRFAQHVAHVAQLGGAAGSECSVLVATFEQHVLARFVLSAYSTQPFDLVPDDACGTDCTATFGRFPEAAGKDGEGEDEEEEDYDDDDDQHHTPRS